MHKASAASSVPPTTACLCLASSIVLSPLWSLSFLFTDLTTFVAAHTGTHTCTVPPCVFSSFFLPFLHSLGITSTLINITALNIPFPFLVPPLLFHHLPLPYLLCASVFVPAGLTSLSSCRKHTSRTVVAASQGQWIVSRYKYPNYYNLK